MVATIFDHFCCIIQLASIASAPLSIYSRYSAYTVYSDAAYTLYSAIHSVFFTVTSLPTVMNVHADVENPL